MKHVVMSGRMMVVVGAKACGPASAISGYTCIVEVEVITAKVRCGRVK